MVSLFRDKDWQRSLVDVVLSIPKVLGFVVVSWRVNNSRLGVEWTNCRLETTFWVTSGRAWEAGIGQSCI